MEALRKEKRLPILLKLIIIKTIDVFSCGEDIQIVNDQILYNFKKKNIWISKMTVR